MGWDDQGRSIGTESTARRSAWRALARVACALVLLWGAIGARPAAADLAFENWVHADCRGLTLSSASGVPSGAVHVYRFKGACNLTEIHGASEPVLSSPPVVADATWDVAARTFTESVHLVAPTMVSFWGDYSNSLKPNTTVEVGTGPEVDAFKCDTDPVLTKSAHCRVASWHNGTGWGGRKDGFASLPSSYHQPILLGLGSKAKAAQLSIRHP